MNSNQIDWNNILYFKEILYLLDDSNIIEYSLSSKFMRNKIKLSMHNYIYYTSFARSFNHESTETDSSNMLRYFYNPYNTFHKKVHLLVNRFELNLLTIPNTVETFSFSPEFNYYYSFKAVNNLNNITHLNLYFASLPLELFQYLLNNLKLRQLTVEKLLIFNNTANFSITLPQALTKIQYSGFSAGLIIPKKASADIFSLDLIDAPNNFFLQAQFICSLQSLAYKSFGIADVTETSNFGEFLILNPQLKSISATQDHFCIDNFKVLSSSNQVKHISIDYFEFDRNYIFELPKIISLNSLSITLYFDPDYSMELIKAFPNLTHFVASFNYSVDNLDILWFASLMKNLRYLSLNFLKMYYSTEDIKFPIFDELEVFELSNINPDQLDWDQLALMPKLAMVKLYGECVKLRKKPFQYKIENICKWKLIYYNDSIVYHKA